MSNYERVLFAYGITENISCNVKNLATRYPNGDGMLMRNDAEEERSLYDEISPEFMREVTLRFARGNVRLILGDYSTQEDVEQMRKEVLAHDFR